MVTLVYNGRNSSISNALGVSNRILNDDLFYQKIASLPQLDNTTFSSRQIADIMKKADHRIFINTYWRPFSSANAKTGQHDIIQVNTAKFSSVTSVAVNTLIHETVHAIDLLDEDLNFIHFDNDPDGEENTAPWRIGAIAESIARM